MRNKSFNLYLGSQSLVELGSDYKPADLDRRIAGLLLSYDANLLAIICQASFTGDMAASVSLGVLALLRTQTPDMTEPFLKRLLRGRIAQYLKRNRDLSDIIRDNSMATMLLNAFTRYEGLEYLDQNLREPLKTVLTSDLISKCEIDQSRQKMDETELLENDANLRSCTTRFIDSILLHLDAMPPPIRRMCAFLHMTVEDLHSDMFPRPVRQSKLSTAGPHAAKSRSLVPGAVPPDASLPSSLIQSHLELAYGSYATASGNSPSRPMSFHSVGESVRSQGILTVAEKVVGSFLFLRFFVPAITSPESFGLVSERITPASRRGLVLCGKVLTALCNDVDFANKEGYLVPLNSFLHENRDFIKTFLKTVATMESKPRSPAEGSKPSSDKANPRTSLQKTRRGSAIGSTVFSSMPSLKPAPTENVARSRTSIESEHTSEKLYYYLGKSLAKIEKDISDQLAFLGPDQTEGVVQNFYELKRLIERSKYNEDTSQSVKERPGALMAGLRRFFFNQ